MEMYKCDHCDGKGTIPVHLEGWSGICPKCMGTGNVDWVENVVWKNNKSIYEFGTFVTVEVEKPYSVFEGNFVALNKDRKIIPCTNGNSEDIFGVVKEVYHKSNSCRVLINTNYGNLEFKNLQPEQN